MDKKSLSEEMFAQRWLPAIEKQVGIFKNKFREGNLIYWW